MTTKDNWLDWHLSQFCRKRRTYGWTVDPSVISVFRNCVIVPMRKQEWSEESTQLISRSFSNNKKFNTFKFVIHEKSFEPDYQMFFFNIIINHQTQILGYFISPFNFLQSIFFFEGEEECGNNFTFLKFLLLISKFCVNYQIFNF